mmetsp:Transcript_29096/g.55997  ORF Transcript_29096/g.55997 Transcript_29096/m.55997 type:complete len:128 (+) Transcript_29096:663-1046(+)
MVLKAKDEIPHVKGQTYTFPIPHLSKGKTGKGSDLLQNIFQQMLQFGVELTLKTDKDGALTEMGLTRTVGFARSDRHAANPSENMVWLCKVSSGGGATTQTKTFPEFCDMDLGSGSAVQFTLAKVAA